MARSLIIFTLLAQLCMPFKMYGQHKAAHEIAVQVDNDRFTRKSTDRYYSSGIILEWNRTISPTGFFKTKSIEKAIVIGSLQHKIYTPSEITFYDSRHHDRPYASTLTMTGGMRLFAGNNRFIQADITLGVSGPMALGQKLQEWWHQQIGVFQPRGWENQISNSPIAALHLQFSRQWFHKSFIDFISSSELTAGTMLTNIKQGGLIRIGNPLPLGLSVYSGGHLENGRAAKKTEVYFLFGGAVEYVNYNGLIEGNWIGEESPHTRGAVPWVFHGEYGIQLSTWIINATFSYHILSKEIKDGLQHQYASIKLGFRL